MSRPRLRAPMPYFGGKSRIAPLIWSYLGDCANVIEPFCGSAAFLLARPTEPKIETLNDSNCYITNMWRAIKCDPEGVAKYCDDPVHECELHSRHRWLVGVADPEPVVPSEWDRHPLLRRAWLAGFKNQHPSYAAAFRKRMITDQEYYDVKIAGYYLWGMCCWIGSGWCEDRGATSEQRPNLNGTPGGAVSNAGVHNAPKLISQQRPAPADASAHGEDAKGPRLWEKRPAISKHPVGMGCLGKLPDAHRPQLADADAYSRGRGVHGNDAAGTCAARRAWLVDWFGRLADRLRTVRVCCGDWRRVCDSPSVTTRLGLTGLYLDPPYKHTLTDGSANRRSDLYANDRSQDVNALVDDVIAYCLERGSDPQMRVVASAYEGEGYEALVEHGWRCVEWRSSGGYGNRNKDLNINRNRERLYVSPHCIDPDRADRPLFAGLGD